MGIYLVYIERPKWPMHPKMPQYDRQWVLADSHTPTHNIILGLLYLSLFDLWWKRRRLFRISAISDQLYKLSSVAISDQNQSSEARDLGNRFGIADSLLEGSGNGY